MTLAETAVALAVTSMILAAAVASLQVVAKMRERKSLQRMMAAQGARIMAQLANDIALGARVSRTQKNETFRLDTSSPNNSQAAFPPGHLVIVQPSWSPEGHLLTAEIGVVGYSWDPAARQLVRTEVPHVVNGFSFVQPRRTVLSDEITGFELAAGDEEEQPLSLSTGLSFRLTLSRGRFERTFRGKVYFRNIGTM